MKKGFTLLELIVVIIIIGILATLGYTQYSLVIEKGRTTEAVARLGLMQKLAFEYYLKNGSLTGIQNSDVGVSAACDSTSYYQYWIIPVSSTDVNLRGDRCTSGGKTPNASRQYVYWMDFIPSTGQNVWHCKYADDSSSCFGLPP